PEGVKAPCGVGSSCYIGILDDSTVLKYPLVKGRGWEHVVAEEKMYSILGRHPRVLTCFGLNEHGLRLEFAPNGTVKRFLELNAKSLSAKQKIIWCRQTAEAITHAHSRSIIHCNISTDNLLLDGNLNVKLSDFQGRVEDPFTGLTIINGSALEPVKSYLPRPFGQDNERSDIFALGSTFYEIITGHEPYPELDSFDDEEEIRGRYERAEFPGTDAVLGGEIIRKCWVQLYQNAAQCLAELVALE
ncbi:kinase-like protein, partial [Mytilinidion resinicola]